MMKLLSNLTDVIKHGIGHMLFLLGYCLTAIAVGSVIGTVGYAVKGAANMFKSTVLEGISIDLIEVQEECYDRFLNQIYESFPFLERVLPWKVQEW